MLRQALSTARLLDMDDTAAREVVDYTMKLLVEDGRRCRAQHIIVRVYEHVRERVGGATQQCDPYAELKRRSNDIALAFVPQAEQLVARADDPLAMAIRVATAGNIIDFGARSHTEVDIDAELAAIPSLVFSRFDYDTFLNRLHTARTLLYLADNAGEIALDTVLVRQLKRSRPGLAITVATRERPIINDATVEDAARVGMDTEATVISSGSIYPGTVLGETSAAFDSLFTEADMVLSKGQGNFETLCDAPRDDIFFLLRAKCELVAGHVGAGVGELVLWAKEDGA